MLRDPRHALFAALFLACAALNASPTPGWPQFGNDPQHTGSVPVNAQGLSQIMAELLYDPFVELEKADGGGDLFVHYAAPLIEGDSIYMAFKSGHYTTFGDFGTLIWSVKRLRWSGGALTEVWTFDSDWKPEPLELAAWEPVFQPVLAGDSVYVPGLGGSVFQVSKATGASQGRINPFNTIDASRYVAGGLAAAPDGSVIYNAIGLNPVNPQAAVAGAWLVRISPNAVASRVAFSTIVVGAPKASDQCVGQFPSSEAPLPPSPASVPPSSTCGSQRPGINVTPAIGKDGTIYTLSKAQSNDRYSYLVAAAPDLTPRWAASLRGILNDGCGVLVPRDDVGCRVNARPGVDPRTNDKPAGRVFDAGTSSPTVLPDGSIVVGAGASYNYGRGHLFKFDANGSSLATYDFGWDITPAAFAHDGTYSIRIKDNHYGGPPGAQGRYEVTSLDADLVPEWGYASTNTGTCVRERNGEISCVDDQPEGFEWCVNQPAIDASGVTYLNSEDGNLYALDSSGVEVGRIFLDQALGAAYTPIAIGSDGLIYAQNNGRLFVVGFTGEARAAPVLPGARPGSTRTGERP